MCIENFIDKILSERLRKYCSIEENIILLFENNELGNNSTFPNSNKIVMNIINYCNEFILRNSPKIDYYGEYYYFNVNNEIAKIDFCDEINCNIFLSVNSNRNGINNGYERIKNKTDIEYVQNNKKVKCINIKVNSKIINGKIDTNLLYINLMHELLHSYEDYCRIIKNNKTLDDYTDSTNYNDYFNLKNITSSKSELYLCNLFHYFNKSEIRAMVSEFVGEMQQKDLFGYINFEEIIKNTNNWKELLNVGKIIEIIKHTKESDKQNLVNTYLKHNNKIKKITFEKIISKLEMHYFYLCQYLFSKFSKLLYNEYIKQRENFMK